MLYGPKPANRLPVQDSGKLMMLADRWQRAFRAHTKWAGPAKQAVDFFEGRQWTAEQIATLAAQKRPALKFNRIAPIVRLVLGYQRNNKLDLKALPDVDGIDAEQTADAISKIFKQISDTSQLPDVDAEVFLDGLLTGRGVFDGRLDFSNNDLGEMKIRADDPFHTYFDPDADRYDINEHGYLVESRWACTDEIETFYGPQVAKLINPFTMGQTPLGPVALESIDDEVSPVRAFGQKEDAWELWDDFYARMGDFIDPLRRSIRVLDFQCKVRERAKVFVDLETGDWIPVPKDWGRVEMDKALAHAQELNEPLMIDQRVITRIQWSTVIGDIIAYDRPSKYNGFTKIGYFPYFRRGYTEGMVADLIDPQTEVNKRRSAMIDIVSRSANSGWMYTEKTFTPAQERILKTEGAAPGVNIKYRGDAEAKDKPERIQPGAFPVGLEHLESESKDDLHEISGINEAALGQLDQVQSGRALEARQRQAVISVQMYMDNFARTKRLQGNQMLDIVQHHYTEQRRFRILGEDGNWTSFGINQDQQHPQTGQLIRLNDVTLGKYIISISETPLAASFANAQFEEALAIIAKLGPVGLALVQSKPELIIEMSSLPRKDEWIEALEQMAAKMQQPPGPGGAMPPDGGTPAQQGVSLDQAGGVNGPTQIQQPGGGNNVVPFAAPAGGGR